MSERKALRWVSPANAWALGAQLIAFMIPVLAVLNVYEPVALGDINPLLAEVWQWVLIVPATISIAAIMLMQLAAGHGRRMQTVIRVEAITTAVVSACLLLLWGALVWRYGFAANPLTQLLVGGLGLTALGRVVQITVELVKYRRALAAGHTTRVEAIAQPKDT